METPKVSIILPIYNVEKYLKKCLDSVLKQTLQEIEIICVNDGSTDESLNILKEYAQKDSRVVVINKPNSGYGHTMNTGLDAAVGEYIGIVEPDDFIEPEMYEKLYEITKLLNVDFIKADYYHYWSPPNEKKVCCSIFDDEIHYNKLLDNFESKDFYKGYLAHWAGIYKKSFLEKEKIRFLETAGASFQDTGFFFKVFIAAKRGYFLNQNFYVYRRDNENSSVNDLTKVFAICEEYKEIEKFLEKYPEKTEFSKLVQYKKFGAYMWNYTRIGEKFKKEFLKKMSMEFKSAKQKGRLDKNLFGRGEWEKLEFIINHPIMFPLKYKDNQVLKKENRLMDFESYFKAVNASKQIDKLAKEFKNKKIVIYGAGKFAQTLFENFDTKKLNIVAIADKSFEKNENKNFFSINCIAPKELKTVECDVILICTYDSLSILDYLEDEILADSKNKNVKIRPFIKEPLINIMKKIFS